MTLIGIPAKIASSIAGRPSLVPGILMNTFGCPARACRFLAALRVPIVSYASKGVVIVKKRQAVNRMFFMVNMVKLLAELSLNCNSISIPTRPRAKCFPVARILL